MTAPAKYEAVGNDTTRKETGSTTANPFGCGLLRPVVLRLLAGTHTRADRAMYYRTDWWAAKRAEALEAHGRACALCGGILGLQVHHKPRAYRRLFGEGQKC